jgi:hypothetical protein
VCGRTFRRPSGRAQCSTLPAAESAGLFSDAPPGRKSWPLGPQFGLRRRFSGTILKPRPCKTVYTLRFPASCYALGCILSRFAAGVVARVAGLKSGVRTRVVPNGTRAFVPFHPALPCRAFISRRYAAGVLVMLAPPLRGWGFDGAGSAATRLVVLATRLAFNGRSHAGAEAACVSSPQGAA